MRRGFPSDALDILYSSLSQNTHKQYSHCIREWFIFCKSCNFDCYQPSIANVIAFLTKLYQQGCNYSSLNTYRSAISFLVGSDIGNNLDLKRFFKGVFRSRPPLPKYDLTWDPDPVLDYLSSLYPNDKLTLEILSKKLITLLALVTAHRVQTFSLIKCTNIKILSDKILIKVPDLIKTSRPNSQQPLLTLPFFVEKPEICPAKTLICYMSKTKNLRSEEERLFLSFRKPHSVVGTQTLSRWIKLSLQNAGIDVSIFTSHSTRHASTSKAKRLGLNIDLIRKTAGWSQSSQVFARFYNRNVVDLNNDSNLFARTVCS